MGLASSIPAVKIEEDPMKTYAVLTAVLVLCLIGQNVVLVHVNHSLVSRLAHVQPDLPQGATVVSVPQATPPAQPEAQSKPSPYTTQKDPVALKDNSDMALFCESGVDIKEAYIGGTTVVVYCEDVKPPAGS